LAAAAMEDGLLTFARYAFPPNLLNLCGPNENRELFDTLAQGDSGPELKNLLVRFEGAVPYLRLIAEKNGIKNIFDPRVVEAYWLGNALLNKVEVRDIYSNIEKRFKRAMKPKEWFWIVSESIQGAKPFHGFHVFDVYRRVGLLRSNETKNFLATMDMCRVAWGRVESVNPGRENKKNPSFGLALVKYNPLKFGGGKMRLGEEKIRRSFLLDNSIKPGDAVSLHWDYVCDKITLRQKNNLIYWTNYHLELANKTI